MLLSAPKGRAYIDVLTVKDSTPLELNKTT
jgi:hypothetical protein